MNDPWPYTGSQDAHGTAFDIHGVKGVSFTVPHGAFTVNASTGEVTSLEPPETANWWTAVPRSIPHSWSRTMRYFRGHHLPRRLRRGKK